MKYQLFTSLIILFSFLYGCSSNKAKGNSKNNTAINSKSQSVEQPNIIFFAVDDMNDFVNPVGHKQAITPNMDRLAKKGVTFSNAHAPNSYCAPSRTAIWTGLQSSTTGCYRDEVYQYDYPNLIPLHEAFNQGGYVTYGAGENYFIIKKGMLT